MRTPPVILLALICLGISASAHGAMRSVQLKPNLCKTTGGGKFVEIPGFPGEKIDRRLLPDIRWMKRNYRIFITDGYARFGHAAKGEHPLGLATDIVPHRRRGGTWGKIDRLAEKAEPRQDRPRLPWRWVGYNGDPGHGRGHHLHLSWSHNSGATPGEPARWVLTRKCPTIPEGDSGGIPAQRVLEPLAAIAPAVPEQR